MRETTSGTGDRGTRLPCPSSLVTYLQAGSPSPAVATVGFVVFTAMPHVLVVSCVCDTVAAQKPAPVVMVGVVTPVDCLNALSACRSARLAYRAESPKKLSSAPTRLR